jgi:phospholipid transport system substrate-binding protein
MAGATRQVWMAGAAREVGGRRASRPPRDVLRRWRRQRRATSWCKTAVLAVALVSALLAAGTPARAGEPTDQLKASVERVIRILEDPALKGDAMTRERRAAIRQEAAQIIDFGETARRALGRHWQNLGEAERQEFVALFTDLMERAYISRLELYSGERIAYAGDSMDGDTATVRTRFVTKRGVEIPADYRMLRRGDRWQVYDVLVEGVSLVANYRTQFNRIIQTSSYEELIRKMKAGPAEFQAPAQGPAPERGPSRRGS